MLWFNSSCHQEWYATFLFHTRSDCYSESSKATHFRMINVHVAFWGCMLWWQVSVCCHWPPPTYIHECTNRTSHLEHSTSSCRDYTIPVLPFAWHRLYLSQCRVIQLITHLIRERTTDLRALRLRVRNWRTRHVHTGNDKHVYLLQCTLIPKLLKCNKV